MNSHVKFTIHNATVYLPKHAIAFRVYHDKEIQLFSIYDPNITYFPKEPLEYFEKILYGHTT